MKKIITELIPLLKSGNIKYSECGDRIRVKLPNDFGEIEVGDLPGNDDVVGLVDEEWHTHSDCLKSYEGKTKAEAVYLFLKGIFEGRYHLIEELKDGKKVRRTIEDDLEKFYKYLPPDLKVKIYNQT